MNTNVILSAEEIARACSDFSGAENRQAVEDAFERQTPPAVFIAAIGRADRWPKCQTRPEGRYGLQYAYLLEFLICDEMNRQKAGGEL